MKTCNCEGKGYAIFAGDMVMCDCERGKQVDNAVKVLGVETVNLLLKHKDFLDRLKRLKDENKRLHDELCDAKGWARIAEVDE